MAELTIDDVLASRIHASISMRRGKFILTDHSTNGTYVRILEDEHYLRKEEIGLMHEGEISLGREFLDPLCTRITFRCRDS